MFELATAITNQTSVNCVAITPQADSTVNSVERDFLKKLPTAWTDTKFIDGYPTRYAVIARKDAATGKWYVGGLNGTDKPMTLNIALPMMAGEQVNMLCDGKNGEAVAAKAKVARDGRFKITLKPMGGIVIF